MHRQGFTLIEILIVIVLVGILAVGALTGLTNIDRSAKLNAAYSTIVNMIQQARSHAVNGKKIIDYTDANHNGDSTDTTVANAYGIYFSKKMDKYAVYVFADYDNSKDQFNMPSDENNPNVAGGEDLILEKYELQPEFVFNDASAGATFLYYPPLGKFVLKSPAQDSVTISICYKACGANSLKKEITIYAKSSGLPE